MEPGLHGGLKDIFNTILKKQREAGGENLPPIIVLHGNGNVIAPGGTVHVHHPRPVSRDSQVGEL